VAGVIGDPVRHSLSPALHNAAFAALGLDWVYVAFAVAPGCAAAAVEAMRVLEIGGLSVTMPHKSDVVPALDRLAPTAARLGAVNTISWAATAAGEALEGDSTDGAGFLDALHGDDGFDPAGRACVVLGSGGAARAVTLALAEAGAREVQVVARRADSAASCAELAGPVGRAVLVNRDAGQHLGDVVEAADLVVNATPVGMGAADGLPFDVNRGAFHGDQFVADLVYAPATTPLLAAARAGGAATANGLGMLINQAARQVAIWTGQPAPVAAMSAAAVAALAHGGRREG
jgi:shikimate dehydrogenase